MNVAEEIAAILRARGAGLGRADLAAIDVLISSLSPAESVEVEAWVYEGVANLVMGPLYRGELTLEDLRPQHGAGTRVERSANAG